MRCVKSCMGDVTVVLSTRVVCVESVHVRSRSEHILYLCPTCACCDYSLSAFEYAQWHVCICGGERSYTVHCSDTRTDCAKYAKHNLIDVYLRQKSGTQE